MPVNTTLVTVGTSLIGNLKRLYPFIAEMADAGNISAVAGESEKLSREEIKLLSAELNSTSSMLDSGIISSDTLVLIVSDTSDGEKAGKLLQGIFTGRGFAFRKVAVDVVKGLNDSNIDIFKREGLVNLVTILSRYISQYAGGVCINNTGGYKAEVAFAGIIGQAFSVPVYYQHERFGSMIELPPLPVSPDLALWRENMDLFMDLSSCTQLPVTKQYLSRLPEKIRALCESGEIDGIEYLSLNAAGCLYDITCGYQFSRDAKVYLENIPQIHTSAASKEFILCGDHHGKESLRPLGMKVLKSPYIVRITNSMPFERNRTDPVRRITETGGRWYIDIVDIESDAGFTLRAETTARSRAEAELISADLRTKYL